MPNTDVGSGATISFGQSSFAMNIDTFNWSGISRQSIATSHLATDTADTFMPGDRYDPGELSMDLHYDESVAVPISAAAETITVTFPSAAQYVASGFVTDFAVTNGDEEKITATMTVKFSGAITGL